MYCGRLRLGVSANSYEHNKLSGGKLHNGDSFSKVMGEHTHKLLRGGFLNQRETHAVIIDRVTTKSINTGGTV